MVLCGCTKHLSFLSWYSTFISKNTKIQNLVRYTPQSSFVLCGLVSTVFLLKNVTICPASPDEEDLDSAGLLLRTYLAGPVSLICNDLKGLRAGNALQPSMTR
jgi:hypothetical protein